MEVTFLGTGTSMGVPVAGGLWANMLSNDPRNFRNRCSLWIKDDDDTSILIDAGPEFRLQSIQYAIKKIDAVLLTHHHYDHIGGIEDLRSFSYEQGQLNVYCNQVTKNELEHRCHYLFGDNRYEGSAKLLLHTVNEYDEWLCNHIKIKALPVNHGLLNILGFQINELFYLTDLKKIDQEVKELLNGAKCVIMSGLRWKPTHPTHQSIPEAIDLATELGIQKTYLIHMNAQVDHQEISAKLPEHVELAFDGLQLNL